MRAETSVNCITFVKRRRFCRSNGDVDDRRSYEAAARAYGPPRAAPHVRQRRLEQLGPDQQPFEGVARRRAERDLLHRALSLPGEPDFGPGLYARRVVSYDVKGYFFAVKSADAAEHHRRYDDYRNHRQGDDPEGQFTPMKLARHSANINMSYWDRLSYAGK